MLFPFYTLFEIKLTCEILHFSTYVFPTVHFTRYIVPLTVFNLKNNFLHKCILLESQFRDDFK